MRHGVVSSVWKRGEPALLKTRAGSVAMATCGVMSQVWHMAWPRNQTQATDTQLIDLALTMRVWYLNVICAVRTVRTRHRGANAQADRVGDLQQFVDEK